jgi:hypothetical protein
MLYPLSYEGGDVFVQVRGYFEGLGVPRDKELVPLACPMIARHAVT